MSDMVEQGWLPIETAPGYGAAEVARFVEGEMVDRRDANGDVREFGTTEKQTHWRPYPQTWFPIETAPKDGTRILVYREDLMYVASYSEYWRRWTVPVQRIPGEWEPSHEIDQVGEGAYIVARGPSCWMPLPPPPTDA